MRTPRRSFSLAVRVIAAVLVSIASLNFALGVAQAVFLDRQGQRDLEVVLVVLAWLVVLAAGLMLYARGDRLGDRVGTSRSGSRRTSSS
jgi:hypothetical protein